MEFGSLFGLSAAGVGLSAAGLIVTHIADEKKMEKTIKKEVTKQTNKEGKKA
jgi:hypothetical protein